MTKPFLKQVSCDQAAFMRRSPVNEQALEIARKIVDDVRARGEPALRAHAERLGDIEPGKPLIVSAKELQAARESIDPAVLALLERTGRRIRDFALAQASSLKPIEVGVLGGAAGQSIAPVQKAGCYAPGGRFPLPSSVLMTGITALAAGVEEVWIASPRPQQITLAAASVAGAQGLLAAGGAQAIAALAFGAGAIPACDVVVGPGNRFVTAAKQLVFGHAAIDMLAGPSELVILADSSADARIVAADLLAQAEHDPDALPVLISTSRRLIEDVEIALEDQLAGLPTAQIARAALQNGFAVLAPDLDEAIRVCDRLAPEHLELHLENANEISGRFRHYGALFVGSAAAEVLGDYGAGPNHTLPTGGAARYTGGLSVFDFLRVRTWLKIDDPAGAETLIEDAERLAELEGLAAHARSAALRREKVS